MAKAKTKTETKTKTEAGAELRERYLAAREEIRGIAAGGNAEHRMLTWREAVASWEETHGVYDEHGRAAFFVAIEIATTDECKLLDDVEDVP